MKKRIICQFLVIALITTLFNGWTLTASAQEVSEVRFVRADSIEVGSRIMFVYSDADIMQAAGPIAGNSNKMYLSSVTAEQINGGVFSAEAVVFEVEAGTVQGTYSFQCGGKYLASSTSSSSNNYVFLEADTKSAATDWSVVFDDAGGVSIFHPLNSTVTRYLRYNQGSPRFSSYVTGQSEIVIYKQSSTEAAEDSPEDIDIYFVDGTNAEVPFIQSYKTASENESVDTSEDLAYPGYPLLLSEGQEMGGRDYYKITLNTASANTVIIGNGNGQFSLEATANHSAPLFFTQDAIMPPASLGGNAYVVYSVRYEGGVIAVVKESDVWPAPKQMILEPSCTENGVRAFIGLRTGSSAGEETIPALGHDWSEWVGTSPSCTAAGHETRICSRCGTVEERDQDAYGHDYSYSVTANPTTSEAGVLTGTCSRCQNTETVTLPKLNTTDYYYTILTQPSCTTTGVGRYTWKSTTYGTFSFHVSLPQTEHDYAEAISQPTCTEQGYTTYTCTNCGDSYRGSFTDALGHDFVYTVTTEPTMSTAGCLTGICSHCQSVDSITLPKLNTTNYYYTILIQPGCTATGVGRYTWKNTSYGSFSFDMTLPKTEHSYIETVTVPTCTEQGFTTHTCTACGDTYVDSDTPALGHNFFYTVTVEPTTTMEGILSGSCSRCQLTNAIELPHLNESDYDYQVVAEPTCTAFGIGRYAWKTTTYGTFSFNVTIPKTEHAYAETFTAPTCTEQGFTTHTCAVCGDSYTDNYSDALGHAWNEGEVLQPPTETDPGVKLFTCTRCGETKTESIPAVNHVHNYHPTVIAPTCTQPGYTLYKCECGDNYKCDETAALGHDFGSWATVEHPTCFTDGMEQRNCSRCNALEIRAIPALGHVESGWITDEEATCITSGAVHTVCTRCGEILNTEIIPALGHAWDEGVVTLKPTHQGHGQKTMICLRCGATECVEMPKLANPFEDVYDEDFFFNPVMWALDEAITGGTDDTHFSPYNIVMRCDSMVFFWAAKGRPTHADIQSPFVDVKPKHWYYDAVMWAVENQITAGTDATHFSPKRTCSRSEILQFLYAAVGKPEYTIPNPYSDVKPKHWYYDGAIWAFEFGLEKGENGKFNAKTSCTRGYVVTYLYRFITGQDLAE